MCQSSGGDSMYWLQRPLRKHWGTATLEHRSQHLYCEFQNFLHHLPTAIASIAFLLFHIVIPLQYICAVIMSLWWISPRNICCCDLCSHHTQTEIDLLAYTQTEFIITTDKKFLLNTELLLLQWCKCGGWRSRWKLRY